MTLVDDRNADGLGRAWSGQLAELAEAAASQPVRAHPEPHDEDAVRGELLRGALDNRASFAVLVQRLTPGAGRDWCLVALGDPAGGADGLAERQVEDGALARCARMLCPGGTATSLHGRIWVLAPFRGGAQAARLAEQLRAQYATLLRRPLVGCRSDPFGTLPEPLALVRQLDRALRVLGAADSPADRARVGTLAELRPRMLIAELGELALHHPSLLSGALDVLRGPQSPRNREYLDSLLAYFDAGCDLTEAAKSLCIHRNTLRYRLQRIEALCDLRLDDPVQRFTAELQVRLHFLTAGWP